MKKRVFAMLICICFFAVGCASASAGMKLIVDGKETSTEVKEIDGTYYISVADAAKLMKKYVNTDEDKGTITLVRPKTETTKDVAKPSSEPSKDPTKSQKSTTSSKPSEDTEDPKDGIINVGKLRFSDIQTNDNSGFGYTIAAELYNGEKDYQTLMFKASFYDENNKRVGTADGIINDLAKGETKTIEFITLDDLKSATTIKIQVDVAI